MAAVVSERGDAGHSLRIWVIQGPDGCEGDDPGWDGVCGVADCCGDHGRLGGVGCAGGGGGGEFGAGEHFGVAASFWMGFALSR